VEGISGSINYSIGNEGRHGTRDERRKGIEGMNGERAYDGGMDGIMEKGDTTEEWMVYHKQNIDNQVVHILAAD
jgi:hypothetical protein